jgi:hypothetical protein
MISNPLKWSLRSLHKTQWSLGVTDPVTTGHYNKTTLLQAGAQNPMQLLAHCPQRAGRVQADASEY